MKDRKEEGGDQASRHHRYNRVQLAVLLFCVALVIAACARTATVLPAPTVTSISPAAGAAGGGTEVTITGTNFFRTGSGRFSGPLQVTVCGLPLTDVELQGRQRRIVLPGGASASITQGTTITGVTSPGEPDGSGDVTVRLPDGQTATLAGAFSCPVNRASISSFTAEPATLTIGAPVTFSWQIANPGGSTLTCTLDPGTGPQPIAACAETGTLQHTFQTPGTYTAILSVQADGAAPVTAEATVVVNIAAPVAVDDSYSAALGGSITLPAPGVLANDTPSGATPTAGTTTSGGGSVSLAADGSFSYQAAAGFTGADTFSYTLTNAAGTDTATVTITVGMAPTAADDHYVTGVDIPLVVAAPGVLANDAPNGAAVSHDALSQQGGTVTVAQDGSLNYVPPAGFTGTDSFGYTLTNGNGTASATVTIGVNASPQALDDNYATGVDTPLAVAAPGILANDAGVPAPTVTPAAGTGNQGGTFEVFADGAVTFTPAAGYIGTDSFSYEIRNSIGSDTATVSVTVGSVPVAVADAMMATRDTPLIIPLATLMANDQVNGGTLNLDSGASQHGGTLTLVAGSLTYTPALGFTGDDSFDYLLVNGLGSSRATVTVTVGVKPDAVPDNYAVAFEQLLTVSAPGGVLSNDTGLPAPTVTAGTETNASGTLTIAADGSFTFQPASGFTGNASFDYEISNPLGSSTGTIHIAVGTAAVAVNDDLGEVVGNTFITWPASTLLANDTGDALMLTGITTTSLHGGTVSLSGDSVTYTPQAGFTGTDSFSYSAGNGLGSDSAAVYIDVVGPIWFVDAQVAVTGNGTIGSPVKALADLPFALQDDEIVFFYAGDYAGSPALADGTRLIAQTATGTLADLAGLTGWHSSATQPTLTGPVTTVADLVTFDLGNSDLRLQADNHIYGLMLEGSATSGALLSGSGFGTFTARDVGVNAVNRPALSLDDGAVSALFLDVRSSGSAEPFALNDLGGSLSVRAGSLAALGGSMERCVRVNGSEPVALVLKLDHLSLRSCGTGVDVVLSGQAEARLGMTQPDIEVDLTSVNLLGTGQARIEVLVTTGELESLADAGGIGVFAKAEGDSAMVVHIVNSVITGDELAVNAFARQGAGASLDLTVSDSLLRLASTTFPYAGLAVTSGVDATDTVAVCATVSGNNFTTVNTGVGHIGDILIDQLSGSTLRVPGYSGAAGSASGLQNHLSSFNNSATVSVTSSYLNVTGGTGGCILPDLTGGL